MHPTFHFKYPTHRETLFKFLALLAIVVLYFVYVSWKYGTAAGFSVTVLTWSFFLLCTPVADAGFILAFPIRLLFGIKMVYTQITLWIIGVLLNIGMLYWSPETYDYTFLTTLLKQILIHPYPYWSILIISALGTFLSIFFGDEMIDVTQHQHRKKYHHYGINYRTLLVLGFTIITITAYYQLLHNLNIELPL